MHLEIEVNPAESARGDGVRSILFVLLSLAFTSTISNNDDDIYCSWGSEV